MQELHASVYHNKACPSTTEQHCRHVSYVHIDCERLADLLADLIASPRAPPTVDRRQGTTRTRNARTTPNDQHSIARAVVRETMKSSRKQAQEQQDRLDAAAGKATTAELERLMTRRWHVGDIYAPHDLSEIEMAKWRRTQQQKKKTRYDVMDQLNINPLHHYKNFSIMSEYMSSMGRIKHRNDSGLRGVNQRKMAKAIRRAIGIGLMPGTYRHPEILRADIRRKPWMG